MAPAAIDPGSLASLSTADKVAALRRQMASVPGRSTARAPSADIPDHAPIAHEDPADVSAARPLRSFPAPLPIRTLLPSGALARGTSLSVTGALSVLTGLVAAASAAGHHVALIGQPRFGILAAVEQGARLDKISFIPAPGDDPLTVASICLDGIDLVVTTLHGRDIAPTRGRALLARMRSQAAVLVTTDGRLPGTDFSIASKPVGVDGITLSRGRVRAVTIESSLHGRGTPMVTGRFELRAAVNGSVEWTTVSSGVPANASTYRRTAASGQ
ncbi:hypothetical protein [Rhodococcus sp. BS-15]|uniref:hypothetical protein n=1 Tax=Rhodococcus sp. BS-15 TaxID=1304954 RepID=UPI000FFB58EC|nr:hypothetical protein [Rhodococcus sp. BS-15]